MARVKKSSRHAALAVAFIGVMAAAGGLLGAIGGVALALLTRIILGLSADTTYLMAVSLLVGAVGAMLLALAMVLPRDSARVTPQSRVEIQAQPDRL